MGRVPYLQDCECLVPIHRLSVPTLQLRTCGFQPIVYTCSAAVHLHIVCVGKLVTSLLACAIAVPPSSSPEVFSGTPGHSKLNRVDLEDDLYFQQLLTTTKGFWLLDNLTTLDVFGYRSASVWPVVDNGMASSLTYFGDFNDRE